MCAQFALKLLAHGQIFTLATSLGVPESNTAQAISIAFVEKLATPGYRAPC